MAFTEIAGATNSSFDTGATALGQSGTFYRVVVSNSLGSVTSSAAQLTVTPAPVAPAITVQPADQTVTAPATATFSVTATGTTLAYQWQSSSDAGATFAPVVGGPDAPTLAVANTTVGQSGQRLRVRVSNAAGTVTSNAAILTVNAAPSAPAFTSQPLSQSIVAGAAVSFVAAATGSPTPTLQWRLGGANLADGVLSSGACAGAVVAGATSSTLSLTAVPIGCSGAVFSVVASNGVSPDATSTGATLTVNAAATAPGITLQPADTTVVAPATATFTAAAIGVPSPTVQWQQSTDAGVIWANITAATNPSYTAPATVLADSGKRFRAVFTNASGSVNSNAAVLTVTAGGPAATIDSADGVAVDSAGNVYVANTVSHTILKISSSGTVSTLAGLAGSLGGTDGTGSAARFAAPRGIAVDLAGNVYVADTSFDTIRKITPAGVVTTLAGSANSEGSADGAGSASRFFAPFGIAVDAAGNISVADTANDTIRSVTPAGVVSTLAGSVPTMAAPMAPAVRPASAIRSVSRSTSRATSMWPTLTTPRSARSRPPASSAPWQARQGNIGSADGTGSSARFSDPRGWLSMCRQRLRRRQREPLDPEDLAGRGRHDAGGSVGQRRQRRRRGQCGSIRRSARRRRRAAGTCMSPNGQRLDPQDHACGGRHHVRAVTGRAREARRRRADRIKEMLMRSMSLQPLLWAGVFLLAGQPAPRPRTIRWTP